MGCRRGCEEEDGVFETSDAHGWEHSCGTGRECREEGVMVLGRGGIDSPLADLLFCSDSEGVDVGHDVLFVLCIFISPMYLTGP